MVIHELIHKIIKPKSTTPAKFDTPKTSKQTIEEIVNDDDNTKIVYSENETEIYTPEYIYKAEPTKTGQKSEILLLPKKNNISRIKLYENNEEILNTENSFLIHTVTKEEQGTNFYNLEIEKNDGEIIKTKKIPIHFTGEKIYYPPKITSFFSTTDGIAGNSIKILGTGKAIGDNNGNETLTFYENNKLLKTSKKNEILETIIKNEPGEHTYHLRVEDDKGQSDESKKIKIKFTGEPLNPNISYYFTNDQNAGKVAQIVISAEDKYNYDKNAGISKIILYEDGKKIDETTESSKIFKIEKNQPQEHIYTAEIYNTANKKTITKEIKIKYSGEYLPPEINQWFVNYKPEKNIADIMIIGKEEKNRLMSENNIKEITLYEDNKPLTSNQNSPHLIETLQRSGTHTYHAKITNIVEKSITTDPITIKYK